MCVRLSILCGCGTAAGSRQGPTIQHGVRSLPSRLARRSFTLEHDADKDCFYLRDESGRAWNATWPTDWSSSLEPLAVVDSAGKEIVSVGEQFRARGGGGPGSSRTPSCGNATQVFNIAAVEPPPE